MVDNPELIELLETEVDFLISKAHKSGLNFWQILRVFLLRCEGLMIQSEAEYYQKGGR